MLHFISAILFCISANIDNIAIGVSYGIKKIHISVNKNIIISGFMSLITYISMMLGSFVVYIISPSFTNLIGAIALISIGTFTLIKDIIKYVKHKEDRSEFKDINKIKAKELFTIILTLSANNIATGIAASLAGISIFYTTIFTFIFSFLFLHIGNSIGKNVINKYIQKYSIYISSIILILLGILELCL